MTQLVLSYDTENDEYWRLRFEDTFGPRFDIRVLRPDTLGGAEKEAYLQAMLDNGYLSEDTVVVVLVGPQTYRLARVDWEVAGALEQLQTRPAGLLTLRLPNRDDAGRETVNASTIPVRIADNVKSGYVKLHDWTESVQELERRVNTALRNARSNTETIANQRDLLAKNLFR